MTPASTTRVFPRSQAGWLLPAAQCLTVALVLMLIAGILHLGVSPYIAFALMGALVLHIFAQPSMRELFAAAVCGVGFGVVYVLGGGPVENYQANWIALPGGLLGMGSIEVLAAKWICATGENRRARFELVRDASLVAGLCITTVMAVSLAAYFTPLTFDRLLLAADLKFGEPPGWIVGRWFRSSNLLFSVCAYAYNSLPLGLAVCLAMEWRLRRSGNPPAMDLRWQAVALGVTGFALYQICPAAGPIYLVGKVFPFQPADLTGIELVAAPMKMVARNAMPSLHVGWTLLLFWSTRSRSVWVRFAVALYLLLTALATLGLGEHYLVDLMMAPAVALITYTICSPRKGPLHWAALGWCVPLTVIWLVAFRTGWALSIPQGAWMWILAVFTAAVPLAISSRLQPRLE